MLVSLSALPWAQSSLQAYHFCCVSEFFEMNNKHSQLCIFICWFFWCTATYNAGFALNGWWMMFTTTSFDDERILKWKSHAVLCWNKPEQFAFNGKGNSCLADRRNFFGHHPSAYKDAQFAQCHWCVCTDLAANKHSADADVLEHVGVEVPPTSTVSWTSWRFGLAPGSVCKFLKLFSQLTSLGWALFWVYIIYIYIYICMPSVSTAQAKFTKEQPRCHLEEPLCQCNLMALYQTFAQWLLQVGKAMGLRMPMFVLKHTLPLSGFL